MANEAQLNAHTSIAQRKAQLVAEGKVFRTRISSAKEAVKAGVQAESLTKAAISHIAAAAFALIGSRGGIPGVNLQTVVPLLVGGISALSKKALLKPVLAGAVVLGSLGAVASYVIRKKKARAEAGEGQTG